MNFNQASINFATNVAFPYHLTNPVLNMTTAQLSSFAEMTPDYTACPLSTPSTECLQYFDLELANIVQNGCSFNGVYPIYWTAQCRPGVLNCNLTPFNYSLSFTLTSDNYCDKSVVVSPLTGTLNTFSDDTFSVSKASFLPDTPAFFEASFTGGTAITSVALINLSIDVDGNLQYLVFNKTLLAPAINFTVYNSTALGTGPSTYLFSFDLKAGAGVGVIFATPPVTFPTTFTLEGEFEVTYPNYVRVGSRKRSVSAPEDNTISLSLRTVLILKSP